MKRTLFFIVFFVLITSSAAQPPNVKKLLNSGGKVYPLDLELGGSFGTGDQIISLKCKVTKDGKDYVYTYKAKNLNQKTTLFFTWAVLDRAVVSGWSIPHWWDLAPQEEIKIVLRHKESPVYFDGLAQVMNLADANDKNWKDTYNKLGVTMPARKFYHVDGFGQPGPLPPSFTKK